MTKPIEPVYRAVGARIEQLRGVLSITQQELAPRVGLTRASIANIEVGRQRISLGDVEKFAAAMGTTPRGLMKGIWW